MVNKTTPHLFWGIPIIKGSIEVPSNTAWSNCVIRGFVINQTYFFTFQEN